MLGSGGIYLAAGAMPQGWLRDGVKLVFGSLAFVSIWFFGWTGPALGRVTGARTGERLLLSFANPLLWVARMLFAVSGQLSLVELAYFCLLPWIFGLLALNVLQFCVAELVFALVGWKRGTAPFRWAHGVLVAGVVLSSAAVFLCLVHGQEWVYAVVHHYEAHGRM